MRRSLVALLALPCAAAFTGAPYRLPSVSHRPAPAVSAPPAALQAARATRLSLRMVAAAPLALPSGDALKTSQLAQLAEMTGPGENMLS